MRMRMSGLVGVSPSFIIALPNDLQRTFALMAELDQKAEGVIHFLPTHSPLTIRENDY
jgi:hypothetical protein